MKGMILRCIMPIIFTGIAQMVVAQVAAVKMVVKVPYDTSTGMRVYIAGSFNSWKPGDSLFQLHRNDNGLYSITLPLFNNVHYEYKYTRGNWSNVEVRTIRGEYIAPLASPAYLERHPVQTPADLLAHRLIYSETPLVQWKQWFGRTGVPTAQKTFDFSFDRSYMSIETAALGLGIALESLMLASVRIKQGLLVPVFDPSHSVEVGAHHLVYPNQNADLPRVARFLAWMEREAAARA